MRADTLQIKKHSVFSLIQKLFYFCSEKVSARFLSPPFATSVVYYSPQLCVPASVLSASVYRCLYIGYQCLYWRLYQAL